MPTRTPERRNSASAHSMFADQCKTAVAQARACLETCFVFLARVTSLLTRFGYTSERSLHPLAGSAVRGEDTGSLCRSARRPEAGVCRPGTAVNSELNRCLTDAWPGVSSLRRLQSACQLTNRAPTPYDFTFFLLTFAVCCRYKKVADWIVANPPVVFCAKVRWRRIS